VYDGIKIEDAFAGKEQERDAFDFAMPLIKKGKF